MLAVFYSLAVALIGGRGLERGRRHRVLARAARVRRASVAGRSAGSTSAIRTVPAAVQVEPRCRVDPVRGDGAGRRRAPRAVTEPCRRFGAQTHPLLARGHRDVQGGCFCRRVRYEVTGIPFDETNCHCSICRRTTGAPFVAWFSVNPSEFRLASGRSSRFRSSVNAIRSFCGHCGTQLTFQSDDCSGAIDITTCSLDHPEAVAPRDHTHMAQKVALGFVFPTGCTVFAGGAGRPVLLN